MTRLLTILAVVGILAVALWVPAQAEMVAVGDSDLATISGKANLASIAGTDALLQGADNSNGNVQVGYFQWDDDHSTDQSNQKGSNIFSSEGGANAAQQNVTGVINEINWGAAANSASNVGSLTTSGDVDIETWGTLYIGGF
jgi:hypothetical protein